ncbi:hypothetical protein BCR32DRAFT_329439 [Anaeromyces robustus]|uniref:LysM domain-containing protein n=1 Tax=Anaeromyces robustus TaxID=1754192 RepID=A0A1Y1WRS3_9FUNG|nr:hypothetical protein BCR32DRAFT_329439 [Anaeromyces robustus]|eukprot:ORX76237.1 hypothetical protein BCR32DRAFT_329439 [Anaeromyces robustus]
MNTIKYYLFLIVLTLYIIPSHEYVAWYKAKNIDFPTKCKVGYNVYKDDTCESIAKKFSINLIDFKRLNSFPCEDLSPSDKVCIGGSYVKCNKWELVLEGTSCEEFRMNNNMNEEKFKTLNPKIRCDNLITEPYLFFCTEGEVINVTYTINK